MPTKITLIFDNPVDVIAFEAEYARVIDLARQLPGLQRLEDAKVWPKEDGTPTPAHRTLDLYFGDYDEASYAVTTPIGGEFFQRVIGTGTPFTGLFSDVQGA